MSTQGKWRGQVDGVWYGPIEASGTVNLSATITGAAQVTAAVFVDEPVLQNSAGFLYFEKQYKYKYNIEEDALVVLEKAAQRRIESKQLVTLEKTFKDMGVAYKDAYKEAFVSILAELRAEIQAAEDEQIALIIASML